LLHSLGLDPRPLNDAMLPVLAEGSWAKGRLPAGYRFAGTQAIRVDLAEKILRAAFDARAAAVAAHPKERNIAFRLDLALSVSIGLEADNARRLLGSAGFRCDRARTLPEGAHGAPAPDRWHWRPRRPQDAGREGQEKRGPRQHEQRGKGEARGKPRPEGQGERKPRPEGKSGRKPDRKPDQSGKPGAERGGRPPRTPRDNRPAPRPDTGPARAGGAFDKLADLLKG
jgi:ATP-dependent RNA helicase SUPV3L1/SUV3